MGSGPTLVQSSPTTRSWLQTLRHRLPRLGYSETKYYAAFRTEHPRRVVAYLNPARQSVRLFLRLDPAGEPHLQTTPSTSSWAARFPSVFPIVSERDLPTAYRLIVKSDEAIGPSNQRKAIRRPEYLAAEELSPEVEYAEGVARPVLVNAYERSRRARDKCLHHYGRSCIVCGLNFEATYGEPAAGYIEVHHIVPIARLGKEYRLNPIADLRPVCPNCHAVIHRREPPFSIEEVKGMLRNHAAHESGAQLDVRAESRKPKRSLAVAVRKDARG